MRANYKPIALFVWLVSCGAISQEIKYTGSESSLEEKAMIADGLCVAILRDHGVFGLGSSGCHYYSGIQMQVCHNFLLGEFQTAKCGLSVRSYPAEKEESLPKTGRPYLLVGRFGSDRFEVDKIVDPTPENVLVVERVIQRRKLAINPQPYTQPENVGTLEKAAAPYATTPLLKHETSDEPMNKDDKPSLSPTASEYESPSLWRITTVLTVAALVLLWTASKRRTA